MIDFKRLDKRRSLAKELVTSYCLDNAIELTEKKLNSGITALTLNGKLFYSLIEENAWVFALSYLELKLNAKFDY
jgi:hypothetical protein